MLPQKRVGPAVLERTGCRSLGWVKSHAWKSWLGGSLWGKAVLLRPSWARRAQRPLLRVSVFMKTPIRPNESLNGAHATRQLLGQNQDPGLSIPDLLLVT